MTYQLLILRSHMSDRTFKFIYHCYIRTVFFMFVTSMFDTCDFSSISMWHVLYFLISVWQMRLSSLFDMCHIFLCLTPITFPPSLRHRCDILSSLSDRCHILLSLSDRCHILLSLSDRCHILLSVSDRWHVLSSLSDRCHILTCIVSIIDRYGDLCS